MKDEPKEGDLNQMSPTLPYVLPFQLVTHSPLVPESVGL